MAEESRGLATEKRSWNPTKLPATTVNSLVSITYLNTTGREGRGGGGVRKGLGEGKDEQRLIHIDRLSRWLSVILGRKTEVTVLAGGGRCTLCVHPIHKANRKGKQTGGENNLNWEHRLSIASDMRASAELCVKKGKQMKGNLEELKLGETKGKNDKENYWGWIH